MTDINKMAEKLAKELMMFPLVPQIGDDCPQYFYEMLEITFAKHITQALRASRNQAREEALCEAAAAIMKAVPKMYADFSGEEFMFEIRDLAKKEG